MATKLQEVRKVTVVTSNQQVQLTDQGDAHV
jgi:hypothetical protein